MKSNFRLIGSNIKHSFSPEIHKFFGYYSYGLQETQSIKEILEEKDFCGLNVTMPYKKECIEYIDVLDSVATETGAVNTVVNRDGVLYGYNTDVFGIEKALKKNRISVKNKNVLILGSGGACSACFYYAKKSKAKTVKVCSRTGDINYNNVYNVCKDAQIIFNTTPIGSVYSEDKEIIEVKNFPHLVAVADMVYNPLKTPLIVKAESLNLKTCTGLDVLVFQALKSAELFSDKKISLSVGKKCCRYLSKIKSNIVLVGMGGAGKTRVGKLLAKNTGRQFFDTDEEFVSKYGLTPNDYITKFSERDFREKESKIVALLSNNLNAVISTGGGVPLLKQNRDMLVKNGKIVFIKRDLKEIDTALRPLYKDKTPRQLYKERKNIYYGFADIVVKNRDIEKTVDKIIRKIK